MIDEQLLDDAQALERADRSGALLALASAGARIRSGARAADEAGLAQLRPEGRPRALLIAGHGAAAQAATVLAALGGSACPVHVLRPASGEAPPDTRSDAYPVGLQWSLPGWAGPADLLVVASTHGAEAGLVSLVERGYQSGCTVVAVSPPGSALADAALQARGMPLPYLDPPRAAAAWDPDPDLVRADPGDLWAVLTPLLALTHRLGLTAPGPDSLIAAADQLDAVAVRCRPTADAYHNPAKSLALRLDDHSLPLLWSDDPLSDAASARFADMLAEHAARPALTAALPEALARHRGLLESRAGAGDPDDFFRDRTEEQEQRPVVLLLHREPDPAQPVQSAQSADLPGQRPTEAGAPEGGQAPEGAPTRPRPSLSRARRLAAEHGIPLHDLATTSTDPLAAVAELIALSDFCAVYLGLAAHPWGD